ncbi:MAG: DEAD/DEAH box helicase [Nanobdellota archaeon]
MKFEELGIDSQILESIKEIGFEEPTKVQEKSIPKVIEGKDVIVQSATGSGKTFAFGSGIIQNINKGEGIQALILAPTRELANQINSDLNDYSKNRNLKVYPIYGGVSYGPQKEAFKDSDIIVGTPGRILDHLRQGTLKLDKVKHAVLDEADRMLDMGFLDDVTSILKQCPKERQTLLFSATIPPEIEELSKKFMDDPENINNSSYVDPSKLPQVYYDTPGKLKFSLLLHLLEKEKSGLVMVFCNSRKMTDLVAKGLNKHKIDAIGIHGGLSQAKRDQVMEKFNSNKALVLVCTDVAARGLDIPEVSHIYNYDIPNESKQYVHRIGRTARAGKSGMVVNILSERDHENFQRVLSDYDFNIELRKRPYLKMAELPREDNQKKNKKGFRNKRAKRRS